MIIDDLSLSYQERVIFTLRGLYRNFGYSHYKMSKFEEYDLYAQNKDFLISDSVITFTDTNGKLMALKPDVTLSIIKNIKDQSEAVQKLFYNETVYRISRNNNFYKEHMQIGLECMGNVGPEEIGQVITLAGKSLRTISENAVLEISNLDLIRSVMDELELSKADRSALLKCVEEKNTEGLAKLDIPGSALNILRILLTVSGQADPVLAQLEDELAEVCDTSALNSLQTILASITDPNVRDMLRIDFSLISDLNYYNGIVFKGFLSGVPSAVLSGGQYDNLMKKMKRASRGVGFAVYLDMLDMASENADTDNEMLNIALPKGRLGEKVYAMFEKAGFPCPSIRETNRKLIFENREAGVRYFWVKPSDVAIYVERGAADIGVAGKDILLEYQPEVYELLDLNIGHCRMAVAGMDGFQDNPDRALRVATKFTRIAQQYFRSKGRDIDIIHLNGSIEIAPILGLSDVIVDIVETGITLKENDLAVLETIVPISARLIANKASYPFKKDRIEQLRAQMARLTEESL